MNYTNITQIKNNNENESITIYGVLGGICALIIMVYTCFQPRHTHSRARGDGSGCTANTSDHIKESPVEPEIKYVIDISGIVLKS